LSLKILYVECYFNFCSLFSHGIENVSSATNVTNVSIHEMLLKVQTRRFIVELAMAKNMDQKVMVLEVEQDVSKVMIHMGKYMFYVSTNYFIFVRFHLCIV
jgi:hypothetical protein